MKPHAISLTYLKMTFLRFQETAVLFSIQEFNTQTSLYLATVTGSFTSPCSPGLFGPHFYPIFSGSLPNPLTLHLPLSGPFPDSPWREAQCPLDCGHGRNADYVMTTGTACSLQTAHCKDRGMPWRNAGSPLAVGTCFNMFGTMKPVTLVSRHNIESY